MERANATKQTQQSDFFVVKEVVMEQDEFRLRLRIPIAQAFSIAMGWSERRSATMTDPMRQILGAMVVDDLEFAEQWRASAAARACLAQRWPGCFPV